MKAPITGCFFHARKEIMITITERAGYLTVTGHAGEPPDLVCEDVTALLQALIMSLEKLTEDQIEYVVEKGMALLTYGTPSERARLLIESFFIGACAVADSFPDKVRVTRQASH